LPNNAKHSSLHYAWIIAGVTFLVLLITAGIRATPGVLIVPFETEFGWSSAGISVAIAIDLALYGLIGPFAAALMNRWGVRKVVLWALVMLAISVALAAKISTLWQLIVLWGICVGAGTGFTATVLAAVIVNRWFSKHRGLVLGAMTAAGATGQLLFLPLMARSIEHWGWRSVVLAISVSAALVFCVVFLLLRDFPAELNLHPFGFDARIDGAIETATALGPIQALRSVSKSSAFWLLAGSFFICGASTNGLIGTHLIPACHDVGIPEVRAAGLLAMMGLFDIVGTTASGWLSDRWSSRYLLFAYYALRGLSLLFLPVTLTHGHSALNWFAVFYGLDWVSTIPPTVRLVSDCFGRQNSGVIFGWIAASHQLGAALAAMGAGMVRTYLGDYSPAFWVSGGICLLTGIAFLFTSKTLRPREATSDPSYPATLLAVNA
jgi:predicted MFS family arabinose efflux permease